MKATWLRRYNKEITRISVDVLEEEPDGYVLVLAHFIYGDKKRRVKPANLIPWEELEFEQRPPGPHIIRRIVG